MTISNFKLNGVNIKTPQALEVSKIIERQRVTLLNGKPKERIKRVYRRAVLGFSMIEDAEVQKIIEQTLTYAIENDTTTISLTFMGLSGEMETMNCIFSDITASAVAESVMNGRWAELDDLEFEEV